MKAVVRANQTCAGIYGAVTRIGLLAVGQTIFFVRRPRKGNVADRNTMSRNVAQPGVEPDGRCHGSPPLPFILERVRSAASNRHSITGKLEVMGSSVGLVPKTR
jgi:hypothetical protein